MNRKFLIRNALFVGVAFALLLTSCECRSSVKKTPNKGENNEVAVATPGASMIYKMAVATLNPVKGSKVKGKVVFTQTAGGVKIVGEFEGLSPGKHGFHIHEGRDCSGDEAEGAGAHFNPTVQAHAGPDSFRRHMGDLGNIVADPSGIAHYEKIDRIITLEGRNTIIGRTVVVHADADDFKTQPAGASGAKIACGVIEEIHP